MDVVERVARDGDDVGELAGLDAAEPVVDLELARRDDRRLLYRLHRRHARLDHVAEFLAVVAVRAYAAVRAEHDPDARFPGLAEGLLDLRPDLKRLGLHDGRKVGRV